MIWFLISGFFLPISGTTSSIMPVTTYPSQEIRIKMPSREMCEQVAKLNPGYECWAKVKVGQ